VVKEIDAVDLAVSPDGTRVLVLGREGALLVFDARLALVKKLKTFKPGMKWGRDVRFAPSGEFFVTSAQQLGGKAGEISVWDTASLESLASLQVKEATQGFQVSSVSQSAVATVSPLALFELR
jgi:WD40 repeat protein